jgi:protein-ribulosamine 3-kinase
MNSEFNDHISSLLNQPISSFYPVSGGDISRAFRVDTPKNSYFVKINQSTNAFEMFQAEANGLQLIEETKTISTPKVVALDSFEGSSFLVLELIETKSPSSNDFKSLGSKLAELHKHTASNFGLKENNFIGSLPQSNVLNSSWVNFYTIERLLPQLNMAKQRGFLSENECPSENLIVSNLENLFDNVKPSLLHGDLWGGNYLISKDCMPYLIDPAVYYGHHEVDIAMSSLFGGFSDDFYQAYHSAHPKDSKTASRIAIYQLYYLLVHLNLFGRSYYGSVRSILKKYF